MIGDGVLSITNFNHNASPHHNVPSPQRLPFLLLITILTMAAQERTRRFTPLTIPVFFGVMVWLEASVSGTGANPARSLGPAVVAGLAGVAPRDQAIYLVGPCLGAALAVGLHRLEIAGLRRVSVARLAHFNADP
jgi:aquaporin Z